MITTLPPVLTNQDYARMTAEANAWAKRVRPMLKRSAQQFKKGKKSSPVTRRTKGGGTRLEYKLADKIDYSLRFDRKYNVVEGIGFSIQRHGVFVHKGVGKGYKMFGGFVMRMSKESTRNPGGFTRQPADWFNPIIDGNVPGLADKMAEIHADLAVNAMRMRIV